MLNGEIIVLAYAFISFIFAYLAINTSGEHEGIRWLNYFLTYFTIFMTGFFAISVSNHGSLLNNLLKVFNNGFSWIVYFVIFYFVLYFLYNVIVNWGED